MPRAALPLATALALATILGLAACASGPRYDNGGGIRTIRGMLQLAGVHLTDPQVLDREVLSVDTVPLPPDQAWIGLLRAYRSLRIPVNNANDSVLWIGGSTEPLGQIGGQKPSTWLDCGHGMADQYADSYVVTFSIATRIVPLNEGSTVESILMASAQPRDVGNNQFRCSSKGTLEARIAQSVRGSAPGT